MYPPDGPLAANVGKRLRAVSSVEQGCCKIVNVFCGGVALWLILLQTLSSVSVTTALSDCSKKPSALDVAGRLIAGVGPGGWLACWVNPCCGTYWVTAVTVAIICENMLVRDSNLCSWLATNFEN